MRDISNFSMISQDLDTITNNEKGNFSFSLNIINESEYVHRISNHPVHIQEENGKFSPSAFIPICEFGGNMTMMGANV